MMRLILLLSLAKDEIFEALKNQRVEIVFTAHPTEVNRRTLLKKYRSISEILASRDREGTATNPSPSASRVSLTYCLGVGTSPYEKKQTDIALRRQVASIWGSDEIRRNKPTPQQEASGMGSQQ
jgi:phosphoenolpyruvate carboxylase